MYLVEAVATNDLTQQGMLVLMRPLSGKRIKMERDANV